MQYTRSCRLVIFSQSDSIRVSSAAVIIFQRFSFSRQTWFSQITFSISLEYAFHCFLLFALHIFCMQLALSRDAVSSSAHEFSLRRGTFSLYFRLKIDHFRIEFSGFEIYFFDYISLTPDSIDDWLHTGWDLYFFIFSQDISLRLLFFFFTYFLTPFHFRLTQHDASSLLFKTGFLHVYMFSKGFTFLFSSSSIWYWQLSSTFLQLLPTAFCSEAESSHVVASGASASSHRETSRARSRRRIPAFLVPASRICMFSELHEILKNEIAAVSCSWIAIEQPASRPEASCSSAFAFSQLLQLRISVSLLM